MKLKLIITTILFCCSAVVAMAQPAKIGSRYVQVSQTIRTQDADENVSYVIKATWKHNETPENIFFRADDVWHGCIVEKDNAEISPEKLKRGDRVTFRSISGGKYAIPEQLKKIPTPALFFQVDKKWYYVPVRNILTRKAAGK